MRDVRSRARDPLATHGGQMAACEATAGYRCRRVDIGEWTQHERALVHPGMRGRESRDADAPATEKQKVDVERSRRVAVRPATTLCALDPLQRGEKRTRAERRADQRDIVDVVGLRFVGADGGARVARRRRDDPRSRQPRNRAQRPRELPARVREIAAQTEMDERRGHSPPRSLTRESVPR